MFHALFLLVLGTMKQISPGIFFCGLALTSAGLLPAQYLAVDLGAPPSGTAYYLRGGNAAQQAGTLQSTQLGSQPHALLLTASGAIDLHPQTLTADSPYYGIANATVNTPSAAVSTDGGSQAGYFINTAVMWTGTANSMKNLHPSSYNASAATSIAGGQQAGWASAPVSNGGRRGAAQTSYVHHAILWFGTSTNFIDLHPAGYAESFATGLSSGGWQVGYGVNNGQNKALMWFGTAASVVNLHPSSFSESVVNGIGGAVTVGTGKISRSGGGGTQIISDHAVIWFGSATNYLDLHSPTYTNTYGLATNDQHHVGYGTTPDGHNHALVWSGSATSVVDLNQFLPAGYSDSQAVSIDGSGTIIGNASGPSGTHPFEWKPQP